MKVLAKDLKPGQIIRVEYGSYGNFVNFTVEDVETGDIVVVHGKSDIGKETLAFTNKEFIEIKEDNHAGITN